MKQSTRPQQYVAMSKSVSPTEKDPSAIEIVKTPVMMLEAERYEGGMFRRLGDRLKLELPKPAGEKRLSWQLQDDLEESLILLLFPAVYEDHDKLRTALLAFEAETGTDATSWKWTTILVNPRWHEL